MTSYSKETKESLAKLLIEKREALRAWRFALSGAKTKNVKEGKFLKKDIARMLTELRAR